GGEVTHLEYEAYAEMAEDVIAQLAAELQARHELCEVAIHHRVGRVEIGEASVVIAVSAPHRQAARAACRGAIDTRTQPVPRWKKELYEGGERSIGRGSQPSPHRFGYASIVAHSSARGAQAARRRTRGLTPSLRQPLAFAPTGRAALGLC